LTPLPRDDREIHCFDRRAATYEHGWRGEFHARVIDRSACLALETVPDPTHQADV